MSALTTMPAVQPRPSTQPRPQRTPGLLTAEEFSRLPDTRGLELDGGVISEVNVGGKASWIGGQLFAHMNAFVTRQRLGWTFPQDTAFECFPPAVSRVRKPDAAFIRLGRLPGEQLPDGFITTVPDLVAEVVSPNDTVAEVERKVRQFRRAGVRLIWVLFPETCDARVFRGVGAVNDVGPDGTLDGEDVLPGFRLPLADLFPPDPAADPAADPSAPDLAPGVAE